MNEDLKIWNELDDARKVVQTLDEGVTVVRDTISGLHYVKDREFSLAEETIFADDICFDNICSLIGVPPKFVDKCNGQTKRMIFEQFNVDKNEMQFVKNGNELVDVLAGEFPFFTFTELFDVAADIISGKKKIQIFTTPHQTIYNFVTYDDPKAIETGDDILRGVTIEISTPGYQRNVSIGTFVLRRVCTNGLIARQANISRIRGLVKEQLFDKSREMIKSAFLQESDRLVDDFMKLKDYKIEDPVGYISRLSRTEGFGRIEDSLSDELLTLDDQSAFEVVNHITSYANRLGAIAGRRLQRMAGTLTSSHIARCSKCFSRLK